MNDKSLNSKYSKGLNEKHEDYKEYEESNEYDTDCNGSKRENI